MIKSSKYTYTGIDQDTSRSKHNPSLYFEGQHIRIVSEDSQVTGSVTNEKGTKEVFSIPNNISINPSSNTIFYGNSSLNYENNEIEDLEITNNHVILGHTTTKNSIILITNSGNLDCIWEVKNVYSDNNNYDVELLYIRNLNLSIDHPIQVLYNFENEKNEKIYWVDGNNQLRFLNLRHSKDNGDKENLIDLSYKLINSVGDFSISQPEVVFFQNGGIHTSGVIQYGYNLYKTNLSQTSLSPLTELIPLGSNLTTEGGDVNETVGTIPVLRIRDIDDSYTNIKVYAIKYTSLNENPQVSIIADREIPFNRELFIYDNGSVISDISIESLTFLGSNPVIPRHVESKDNHLFKFNIKEDFYELENFDSRAYSYNEFNGANTPVSRIASSDNPLFSTGLPTPPFITVPDSFNLPEKHDCINPNYNVYKYQKDGVTLGGEGKYLKYELSSTNINNPRNQYFKSNEIYRISIEFYNNKGQRSLPLWISDLIAPDNNLNNEYNTLTVVLKPEFYSYLNTLDEDKRPTGYKILRANRRLEDRTVLCQGIINPMIANRISSQKWSYGETKDSDLLYDQQIVKYPSLIRVFENRSPIFRNRHGLPLANKDEGLNAGSLSDGPESEGFKAASNSDWRGQLFQFNTMIQMYSPEVVFNNLVPDNTHKLKVKGILASSGEKADLSEINYITSIVGHRVKVNEGISPYYSSDITNIIGGNNAINDGIFAPPGNDVTSNLHQFYREFKGAYEKGNSNVYDIYGTPEVQTLGQGVATYNNDSNFRYSNEYSTILQDTGVNSNGRQNPTGRGYNSNSISSITMVLGNDDPSFNPINRKRIEQIHEEEGFTVNNGAIICELVKPESFKYNGGIYGGNNYESKLRTNYIPIGDYKDISESVNIIDSPGDTFVNNFVFTKSSKKDISIASPGVNQLTEIVSFNVETSIDLINRNDISRFDWDSKIQPSYNEYQRYNTVYSQKENLLKRRNIDFNFKEVNEFGTTVVATKKKISGEIIDSWTDDIINETIDLDGKYGSINSTINYNDNIYTFQDKAVSVLSINPRVQTSTSDGLGLELGSGRVLQEYKYLTTKSGSINKWGVVSGNRGIYYYDALNKSLYRVPDFTDISLSDIKGLRTWFNENFNYDSFVLDNPLTGNGVLLGYDTYNKDLYVTLQGKVNKTRVFNEKADRFIDLKTYVPNRYIDSSYKFFGSINNINVHKFNEGIYNNYFNSIEPSFITLMVNPASDLDCVFNNIIYKSEVYLNDIDQPDQTITHIQAFNEFQDSGLIPLVLRDNIRRKFRDWKAFIPRDGRDRIRNPWIFLKLQLTNENNYRLVLHDINILYKI